MNARGDRRATRQTAHEEKIQQDQERDELFNRRAHLGAMNLQRRAWARGDGTRFAQSVETAGPDGRPVSIRVEWGLGDGDPGPERAPGTPGGFGSGAIVDPVGVFAAVALVALALVGLWLALSRTARWLYLELTGRPHYAVVATLDGASTVALRARRRKPALRYAAALADRVEQDGAAALTPR